jgi:hypothetical protein
MSESRCLSIQNEADVINARLQTRQMAKDAGLSTVDQARISLAVSSMAHIIQMGDCYQGEITLNRIVDLNRSGVQVVWKMEVDCNGETILREINTSSVYMMVHALDAQFSATNGICITAMIWTPQPASILQEGVP